MQIDPIRYCEDCMWFKAENDCHAPQNLYPTNDTDLVVRGNHPPTTFGRRWLTASFQRKLGWPMAFMMRACGKRGRWFVRRGGNGVIESAQGSLRTQMDIRWAHCGEALLVEKPDGWYVEIQDQDGFPFGWADHS